MKEPSAPRRRLLAIFALALLFFLLGTGTSSLFDSDEPRFAEASRDMLARGDLLLPRLNGEPRLDKPILVYWLQMLGYAVFGVGETGARFPSALGLALAVAFTVRIGTRAFGANGGLLAGLVLATCVQAGVTGRAATADGLLLGCVALTMDALHARVRGRRTVGTWLTLWLGVAACGLAKGPPGIVAPLTAGVGAFLLAPREERALRIAGAALGLGLALALVAAWAIPVDLRTDGGILSVALGRHVLDRAGGGVAGHGGWAPWWFLYYVPAVALGFFPWSAWLPAAGRAWRSFDLDARDRAFLGWWIAGTFLVFTLVIGKRPHYVMPIYPALAVLVGGAIVTGRGRLGRAGLAFLASVAAVGAIGLPALLAARELSGAAARSYLGSAALLLWIGALSRRGRGEGPAPVVVATAASMALFFAALTLGVLPALERHRLAPRAGRALAEVAPAGARRVVVDFRPDGLLFYSQRDAGGRLTAERTVLLERIATGRPLLALLRSGEPAAVVLTEGRRDEILVHQDLEDLPARLAWWSRGYYAKTNEWETVLIYVSDGRAPPPR